MALRELLWSWWWWCSCSLVIFKAIVWWNRVIDTIWFAWWSHKAYKYIKHSVFSCYVCCLWWLSSTRHPRKRRPSATCAPPTLRSRDYYSFNPNEGNVWKPCQVQGGWLPPPLSILALEQILAQKSYFPKSRHQFQLIWPIFRIFSCRP